MALSISSTVARERKCSLRGPRGRLLRTCQYSYEREMERTILQSVSKNTVTETRLLSEQSQLPNGFLALTYCGIDFIMKLGKVWPDSTKREDETRGSMTPLHEAWVAGFVNLLGNRPVSIFLQT